MSSAPLRLVLGLCVGTALCSSAAEEHAPNPFGKIEAPAKSSLERDYQKLFRGWCQRVLVEPARERLKGTPYETEALALIEAAIAVYGDDETCRMPDELRNAGSKLSNAGCKDPLVCYLGAHASVAIYGEGHDRRWGDNLLKEAAKAAEEAGASAGVLRALILWEMARGQGRMARAEMDAKAAKWMLEVLADGKTYRGDETAIFVRQIDAGPGADHFKRIAADYAPFFEDAKQWAAAGLPEWARLTLVGYLEVQRATTKPLNPLVEPLTGQGWREWEGHITTARKALTEAWKLRPDLPYAAGEMVMVILGPEDKWGESPKLWFDRANAAQFDYLPAYRWLLYGNRPRWGGNFDRMIAIGCACMDSGRYDTAVPGLFAEACEDVVEELKGDWKRLYRQEPEIARRMVEMQRKYAAEPSRAALRSHDQSQLAMAAWLVGDYAAAEEALRSITGRLHRCAVRALFRRDSDEPSFRSEIAIMRSPAAEPFSAGDLALGLGEFDQALPLFQQALKAAPARVRGFVQERLERVAIGQELAKGDWVKLPVHPGLRLWRQFSGHWECKEDGVLSCAGFGDSTMIVFAQAPRGDFEFRAEFANPAGDGPAAGMPSCGLVIGCRGYEDRNWLSTYIYNGRSEGAVAEFRKRWSLTDDQEKSVELKEWNQFHVVVRHGRVTFRVNGEPVMVNLEPPKGTAEGVQGMVGFTAYAQTRLLQIRNVELRQLR